MERSEWQIAASAARFDGGRDYRRETALASVLDPATEALRSSVPSGARTAAGAVVAAPGVELDWSGRVVHRPSRRAAPAHAGSSVAAVLGGSAVPLPPAVAASSAEEHAGRRHFAHNINLESYETAHAPSAAAGTKKLSEGQATFQFAPGCDDSAAHWRSNNAEMMSRGREETASRGYVPTRRLVPPTAATADLHHTSFLASSGSATVEARSSVRREPDLLSSVAASVATRLARDVPLAPHQAGSEGRPAPSSIPGTVLLENPERPMKGYTGRIPSGVKSDAMRSLPIV